MLRFALVLGLLAVVGPFAIDMYLPAMPMIAADLATTPQAVQTTLTAFFLGFGGAQLVYGPLSDQIGRRAPLLIGLGVFLVGTLGSALAPDIGWLTAARFVQGVGGATVMVIPRAVIRDLYSGPDATRLMALVMLVISIAPMLAPLAGSLVMEAAGWRAIFGVMAVIGVVGIAVTALALPETLRREHRVPARPMALARGAASLLRDRTFIGLTMVGGFGMASFFVFIASAAFVYTETFGLTPTGFSLAFAINALGFFAASQAAAPLGVRFGMARVVLVAIAGFAAATMILLAATLAGAGSLPVIVGVLFVANAFLGLVIPSSMVMALDPHPDMAGLASSLGGTLQMVAGGLMITLGGPFFDGTPTPMIAVIAMCGAIALAAAVVTLRGGAAAKAGLATG